tara:strand:+ start:645 stop:1226 length:582 start_codon:yes stop_codon:yes gene_type:complete
MVFYKSITIICFLFSNIYCLKIPERIHKSFIKHAASTVESIFPNIYNYLDFKSKKIDYKIDYNQNEMINTYKSIYKDACIYLLKKRNNSVYLGWIPFHNKTILENYYKNITKNIDIVGNIKNVPLYYLICESHSNNNTLEIKKIMCNPIIEVNIDLQLLKSDLLNFTNEYNTSLDLSYLKAYDSGRWYFIFNY